jgi:hypothetical protein
VSQIKEQLEAIGDTIKEVELEMTTLNGLLDLGNHSFIEYVQEES